MLKHKGQGKGKGGVGRGRRGDAETPAPKPVPMQLGDLVDLKRVAERDHEDQRPPVQLRIMDRPRSTPLSRLSTWFRSEPVVQMTPHWPIVQTPSVPTVRPRVIIDMTAGIEKKGLKGPLSLGPDDPTGDRRRPPPLRTPKRSLTIPTTLRSSAPSSPPPLPPPSTSPPSSSSRPVTSPHGGDGVPVTSEEAERPDPTQRRRAILDRLRKPLPKEEHKSKYATPKTFTKS